MVVNAQSVNKEYSYTIEGRAVDKNGQAVPFARLTICPSLGDIGGDYVYSTSADGYGNFLFTVADSNMRRPDRLLFLTGSFPRDAVVPIMPPFADYRRLLSAEFAAVPVRVNRNATVDVGDLPVRIFYTVVTVNLNDVKKRPLPTSKEDWHGVWLRIYDKKHTLIASETLSFDEIQRAVNLDESIIRVALPKGTWTVEVSFTFGSETTDYSKTFRAQ
jgi:hypothetical protein